MEREERRVGGEVKDERALTMADWSEIKINTASFSPAVLFLSARPQRYLGAFHS